MAIILAQKLKTIKGLQRTRRKPFDCNTNQLSLVAQKLGRSGEDWLDRLSDEREQIAKQIAELESSKK
jgi:hypothetical protein